VVLLCPVLPWPAPAQPCPGRGENLARGNHAGLLLLLPSPHRHLAVPERMRPHGYVSNLSLCAQSLCWHVCSTWQSTRIGISERGLFDALPMKKCKHTADTSGNPVKLNLTVSSNAACWYAAMPCDSGDSDSSTEFLTRSVRLGLIKANAGLGCKMLPAATLAQGAVQRALATKPLAAGSASLSSTTRAMAAQLAAMSKHTPGRARAALGRPRASRNLKR